MPHFRPLPVLTVFSLIALAILLTLGTWQVQRMNWKADLIAAYEARGEASGFRDAICNHQGAAFGPSVSGPTPLSGNELRYYQLRDTAGWVRVGLMPAPRCSEDAPDRYLFIESGFEDLRTGDVARTGVWRIDPLPRPGSFSAPNEPDTNQWYAFNRVEMARALGVEPGQVLDVWARADTGMPASLAQTPPAKHFGYALTWFGLAAALVGVYLALHGARGRLRWR